MNVLRVLRGWACTTACLGRPACCVSCLCMDAGHARMQPWSGGSWAQQPDGPCSALALCALCTLHIASSCCIQLTVQVTCC